MAKRIDSDNYSLQLVTEPNENFTPGQGGPILQQKSKEKLQSLNRPVSILYTGLPGAGKSTLVNTMLGEVVARTGFGPDSIEAGKDCYEGEFEEVKLKVFDTNGYSKKTCEYNKSSKESFDLILICIKIMNRVGDSEKQMLSDLAKALDNEALKRTIVVLTFANFLPQDAKIKRLKSEEAKIQITKEIHEEFKTVITGHLKNHMDEETACSMPFCLAGECDPFDPTVKEDRQLLTTDDWLVDLWEACALHVNPEVKTWFDRLKEFMRRIIRARRRSSANEDKGTDDKDDTKETEKFVINT